MSWRRFFLFEKYFFIFTPHFCGSVFPEKLSTAFRHNDNLLRENNIAWQKKNSRRQSRRVSEAQNQDYTNHTPGGRKLHKCNGAAAEWNAFTSGMKWSVFTSKASGIWWRCEENLRFWVKSGCRRVKRSLAASFAIFFEQKKWRRERDSNPRWVAPHHISNVAPSSTRPSLRDVLLI